MNVPRAPDAGAQRSGGEQKGSEHQDVAVDDPLLPGDVAAEVGNVGRHDVDHKRVEGRTKKPSTSATSAATA
ncbi:MAG TPA: hypothetical protein VFE65_15230 [Pseudonocardia sp.]|nr:hypothetical protein [Pseudonocardia sp.]